MALGKAFIEVHADTKPFARELERELNRLTKSAEQGNLKATGRKLGESLGDGISEGVSKNKGKVSKSIQDALPSPGQSSNIFVTYGKGLVDALDDGLSGLPAEVKAALGATLAVITPFLGASLAGLIGGSLVAGFAGFGTLLAFQFERVREEGKDLLTFLRNLFSTAASSFIDPVIAGIRVIEERFAAMAPAFTRIFELASDFVEPLVDGLAGFFENLLPGLEESLRNSADLVDVLAFHFKVLGKIIGDALLIITGAENLDEGLDDFLTIVETIIITGAVLIRILTEMYSWFKLIVSLVAPVLGLVGAFDRTTASLQRARPELGGFQSTIRDTIAPTEAEEKALKDINTQLAAFTSNTAAAWHSNINFEQSLDDMSETLKKNRGQLDLNKQAGRDNQSAILGAAEALIRQRDNTITLTGDVAKANTVFEANRKRLEDQAFAAGIARDRFRELTGQILGVPPVAAPTISPASTASVNAAIQDWKELRQLINNTNAAGRNVNARPLGTFKGYADGGVITSPTVGLIGEAGPEAIIPLSNPARAAQVMAQAGLTGGMGSVNVYVGNQQFDAYIDRRVDTRLSMTARSMSYGVRPV